MAGRSASDIEPMVQTFFGGSTSQASQPAGSPQNTGLLRSGLLASLPAGLSYQYPEELVGLDPVQATNAIIQRGSLAVVPSMPRTTDSPLKVLANTASILLPFIGGPGGIG